MKSHYTIFVKVPHGSGDYGGDTKCVYDAPCRPHEAEQMAQSFANLTRSRVDLFKGKQLGRFVATFQ